MTTIIVDTSALISLLIDSDQNYPLALKTIENYNKDNSMIAVPHDVFTECLNVLGKKLGHKQAILNAREIINSHIFQIIDSDSQIRTSAMSKFNSQAESVSFTDCIVMAVADQFNTKQIFGFDKVFKKRGYKIPS